MPGDPSHTTTVAITPTEQAEVNIPWFVFTPPTNYDESTAIDPQAGTQVVLLAQTTWRVGWRFTIPSFVVREPPRIMGATLRVHLLSMVDETGSGEAPIRVLAEGAPPIPEFTSTAFPGTRSEFQVALATFTVLQVATDVTITLDDAALRAALEREGWDGVLSLVLVAEAELLTPNSDPADRRVTVGGPLHASPPTLTLTLYDWHTGYVTDRKDRTRMVHDMRTGLPAASVDLVEDGFSEGIWVQPESWDPDDPFETDDYRQSPREGEGPDNPST